jgi:hypothetical protein
MRNLINKIRLLIAPLLMLLIIVSCEDDKTYMESGIIDMNANIQTIDKTIAQPGDVVTMTGTNLDKVYKIMLNSENVFVKFEATSTELKMTIPALTPLGDVITINVLFSGKGLAQRTIQIISPPVIVEFSPSAVHTGDIVTIYGRELYLAKKIYFGDIEITTPVEIVDDKTLKMTVPEGFSTSNVILETATGAKVTSPKVLILGKELLLSDFSKDGTINKAYSAYSNAKGAKAVEAYPRDTVFVVTMYDNASTWGANLDFTLQKLPKGLDLNKIDLVADVKASKELNVNMMIGYDHNPPPLWGLSQRITTNWQTFTVPLASMGLGYENTLPLVAPMYPFDQMTVVKFSLPAKKSDGFWGETITFDNVKIIVRD